LYNDDFYVLNLHSNYSIMKEHKS